MSDPQTPPASGEVLSFEKSPRYWLRRAQHHRKRGEHRRAAALLRRAVALEPSSGELRMEYAHTLRDMSCYEASTREAFGVLALEPTGFLPYGLIGRNMLSLGREQEAMDAFSHYFQKAHAPEGGALLWDEDDEYFHLEDLLEEAPRQGKARYEALMHIASLRLAYGDLETARKRLARAARLGPPDTRLHALYAMLYQAMHRHDRALHHALLAVQKGPRHVPSLCALASVRMQRGQRGLAAATMLAAAFCCRYPHDEQLFCFTAAALGLPQAMEAMLRLAKRRHPDRVPTLYNLALALLRQGRVEEAVAYLQRCRDLDPEDVTVLFVTQEALGWAEQGMDAEAQRKEAEQLPFYPFLPLIAEYRLLATLTKAIQQGVSAFIAALDADGLLYRQFLYALASPSGLSKALFPVATMLMEQAPALAERLLRDLLLQSSQDEDGKRIALSKLMSLGATPPYVLWQNGRIVQVDPSKAPARVASVTQRLILRRIGAACRILPDGRLPGHALQLLRLMDRQTRYAFAADVDHAWRHALIRHFCLVIGCGAPPPAQPLAADLRKHHRSAFARLCALWPIPLKEDPR